MKKIKFGKTFNKPIENIFPKDTCIEKLYFGKFFSQNIDNLSKTLKHLTIKNPEFNNNITNLPTELISLSLGRRRCGIPGNYTEIVIDLKRNINLKKVKFFINIKTEL